MVVKVQAQYMLLLVQEALAAQVVQLELVLIHMAAEGEVAEGMVPAEATVAMLVVDLAEIIMVQADLEMADLLQALIKVVSEVMAAV